MSSDASQGNRIVTIHSYSFLHSQLLENGLALCHRIVSVNALHTCKTLYEHGFSCYNHKLLKCVLWIIDLCWQKLMLLQLRNQ